MPPVLPAPVVLETIAYYDVVGRSEEDLVKELNAKGPGSADGRRNWGWTQWSAGWDFQTREIGNSRCEIYGAEFRLAVLIVLPRWTPPADVSPSVVEKWSRLSSALEAHEREHAENGRSAISAAAALIGGEHAGSCRFVRRDVEQKAQNQIRRGMEQDKDLDVRTNHGVTEGVAIQW